MADSANGKKKTTLLGVLILLLTAAIWGSAFIAQSEGMKDVGCFTFTCTRSILGVGVLLPFLMIKDSVSIKKHGRREPAVRRAAIKKTIILGLILGVILTVATNIQQFAFNYSSAGKIAFLTALYMFFVPIIGMFGGKKISAPMWVCVVMGIAGMFMLTVNPSDLTAVNLGDVLAFLGAIAFAFHITFIEKYCSESDGAKLSCIQFAVVAVLSGILMFIFEKPDMTSIINAGIPILYAGVASSGIAYTLQIVGQKRTDATVASIIMCLESVFAVIFEAIILKNIMSVREIIGCVVMLAAIIISQLAEAGVGKKAIKNETDAS